MTYLKILNVEYTTSSKKTLVDIKGILLEREDSSHSHFCRWMYIYMKLISSTKILLRIKSNSKILIYFFNIVTDAHRVILVFLGNQSGNKSFSWYRWKYYDKRNDLRGNFYFFLLRTPEEFWWLFDNFCSCFSPNVEFWRGSSKSPSGALAASLSTDTDSSASSKVINHCLCSSTLFPILHSATQNFPIFSRRKLYQHRYTPLDVVHLAFKQ